MKKTFKLFLSLLMMAVMFLGINKVNAQEIPDQVSITGFNWLGDYSTGRYGMFTVEPSGGTHAYCLDANKEAPKSGNLVLFDTNTVYSYAQLNKMIAVLRASGDPQFNLGLNEADSYYVTQAALWYAEYGRTGEDIRPLTPAFHEFLKSSSHYGPAYNKLLAVIDEANSGVDFIHVDNSISINDINGNLTQSMSEVVIDGKLYLLSDSTFVVSAPGNYTVNVVGGFLADSNGNNTGSESATYGVNDSFRIIIPVEEGKNGNASATFTVKTTDSYVSEYSLKGYQALSSSGFQRLSLLFTDEDYLSTNYTVNGSYDDRSTDIKIAKVNKEGKLIAGAKLGIYSDGSLINSYDSTTDYVDVTLSPGTYSLKEISAPSGYLLNDEDVNFTIDEKGNVKDSNGNVIANKTLTITDELPKIKIRKTSENGVGVKGAKIVICSYNMLTKDTTDCNFEWITDGSVKELTVGVDFGKIEDASYIIKEVSAPHGFELSAPKVITVKDGQIYGDIDRDVITLVDEAYVEVSKTDATGQEEIPGAEMKLFDKNGELKDSWTSETSAHKIPGLDVNEVYEIVEEVAPTGYVKISTSIKFVINEEGKVVTMDCDSINGNGSGIDVSSCKVMSQDDILKIKNDIIEVEISKIDITNGQEMEGAKLQILHTDNSPVYQDGKILEWISGTEKDENGNPKPHYIKMLPAGEYKLVETFTPEGYVAVKNEVLFTVDEKAGIQTVVFENKPIDKPTGVEISKRDFTTGEEIEGAHLVILNEDGTIVEQNGEKLEWVSGKEPKKFDMLPEGKYVLVESVPADGYNGDMIIDGMVTSKYNFEVIDGQITRIDVYNQVLQDVPVTGMSVNSTYVFGSMVVLLGCGTIGVARKKYEM